MTANITEIRNTIAKQQVTLEEIIIYAQTVKKEPDLSERETSLVDSVERLADTLSETLERLAAHIK